MEISSLLIISHTFSLLNTNLAQIEKARSLQSSFVCVTGVDLFDLGHRINYGENGAARGESPFIQ